MDMTITLLLASVAALGALLVVVGLFWDFTSQNAVAVVEARLEEKVAARSDSYAGPPEGQLGIIGTRIDDDDLTPI